MVEMWADMWVELLVAWRDGVKVGMRVDWMVVM